MFPCGLTTAAANSPIDARKLHRFPIYRLSRALSILPVTLRLDCALIGAWSPLSSAGGHLVLCWFHSPTCSQPAPTVARLPKATLWLQSESAGHDPGFRTAFLK